jgi:hypothetical protein
MSDKGELSATATSGDENLHRTATEYVMKHKDSFGKVSRRDTDRAIEKVFKALQELRVGRDDD